MPTEIEQGYVDQGYRLPDGWTWREVAEQRRIWSIHPIYVPIGSVGGVCAWGVPIIDGQFLKH